MRADLDALEAAIGHCFGNRQLLNRALTHSSHVHEQAPALSAENGLPRDNEQLEFLGDSVLGFLISEDLLERNPDAPEGRLSKLKAHLVSATWLHEASLTSWERMRAEAECAFGTRAILPTGERRSNV